MSNAEAQITPYVDTLETLLDATVEQLSDGQWNVKKFSRSVDALDTELSAMELPAAVVVYGGSTYQNLPRRQTRLIIVARTKAQTNRGDGAEESRALLWDLIDRLDRYKYNEMVWGVRSDTQVEGAGGTISYILEVDVDDH